MVILTAVGFFYFSSFDQVGFLIFARYILNIFFVMGLVGYAFKLVILRPWLWKVIFVLEFAQFCWLFYLFIVGRIEDGMFVDSAEMGVVVFLFFATVMPQYIAVYFYAFKSHELWSVKKNA